MFCKNCGSEIDSNASFCPNCGFNLNEANQGNNQYYAAPGPQQNFQYQQTNNGRVGTKDKVIAGILGILLGSLGIHKFYLGYTKAGIIMLLVSLLTLGFGAAVMAIIGIIEGIMYLTKSDVEFYNEYEIGQKEWF